MRSQRAWAVQGVTKEKRNPQGRRQGPARLPHQPDREAGVEGPRDGAADRAARRGRGAAQGVAAADGDRRRAAVGLGGRHRSTARSYAAAAFTLGPVDLTLAYGDRVAVVGPNGAGKTTLIGLLLGRTAPDEGSASLGASVRVGEIDQARDLVDGPDLLADVVGARAPRPGAGRRPDPAGEVRAAGRPRPPRRRARCRPGSAPAPRSPCCRPAARTCSSWTSRPTTSTCPRSSSWRARWSRTPGTLVLVSHDRRMLEAVHVTRRLHVDRGRVDERPV